MCGSRGIELRSFWRRMYGCMEPIFLGLVNRGPMDRMVVLLLWNKDWLCTNVKESMTSKAFCGTLLGFSGLVDWRPKKTPMGTILWNKVWIFTNSNEKAVGHCWIYDLLVCFGGGCSNKTAPEFRLVGREVGSGPSSSVSLCWMSSFIFKIWCRLPWFWVHWSCKIWLWTSFVFTFLKCKHSPFFFWMVGGTTWLFLFFLFVSLAKILYIRVCEISFVHYLGILSLLVFFSCFQDFFFHASYFFVLVS